MTDKWGKGDGGCVCDDYLGGKSPSPGPGGCSC